MQFLQFLNGNQVLWIIAGSGILVFLVILGGRALMQRTTNRLLSAKPGQRPIGGNHERVKYAKVDIFRHRDTFSLLGVALGLLLSLALFNFSSSEQIIDNKIAVATIDEDITVEPPRTTEPPPPPPPPPPPVIEEVPEEMLVEEDESPIFLDQSIEAESRVTLEPVEEKKAETVQPPPPPPVREELDEIFKVVEEMPRFPGCEDLVAGAADKKQCADKKLMEFIYENIQYPSQARENNIQGSVVVSFVVNVDGSTEQIEIMRDIGGGCGMEVERVLQLMTETGIKWIPGKQRAKPVRVQFILPVKFVLSP